MPGVSAIQRTSWVMPLRTSGSPPVRRTRRRPMPAAIRTMRAISSRVRISWRGTNLIPASGMQ